MITHLFRFKLLLHPANESSRREHVVWQKVLTPERNRGLLTTHSLLHFHCVATGTLELTIICKFGVHIVCGFELSTFSFPHSRNNTGQGLRGPISRLTTQNGRVAMGKDQQRGYKLEETDVIHIYIIIGELKSDMS